MIDGRPAVCPWRQSEDWAEVQETNPDPSGKLVVPKKQKGIRRLFFTGLQFHMKSFKNFERSNRACTQQEREKKLPRFKAKL